MKKIMTPLESQLLIFPMMECTISAGYRNTKYKKDYGYIHYGIDFDDRWGKDFDIIASGDGVVLATEKNSNSIGGVIVIRYDNVHNPTKNNTTSYIVRYYHCYSIKVKKGDRVSAYQVIGTISGWHKWWNHIHFEVDTDIKHPFHTPQVSEASSALLVRKGATDSTIINPLELLVIGLNQTAKVHSLAVYANENDEPRYEEEARPFVPAPKESPAPTKTRKEIEAELEEQYQKELQQKLTENQKLKLPIDNCKITCGYKNAYYCKVYGFNHYGVDMVDCKGRRDLYGLGYGKVYKAGWDGTGISVNGDTAGCGFVLIVIYNNVYIRSLKKYQNLVCTYMHMAELPKVKAGDIVTPDTLLGYYGDTGRYVDGAHLHIQLDLDDKYPAYCMGMANKGHKILLHGVKDTTVDPCDVLYIGENQRLTLGAYEKQYDKNKVLAIPKM